MKLAQILHVLGPQFFFLGGGEFLDLHYKAHPDCDHVAKFHGNPPRELGDRVAKKIKKKHQLSKTRLSGTTIPAA